mmetsp:Transcript_7125/g.8193  ORF Transcript_7125/g.8193 Transcript_7125/m.8193 type:complete len:136 (+) Transcript_7125:126-533(+)
MHPSKLISDQYPNTTAHSIIENLVAIREDKKKVDQQHVIVFRHDVFDGVEIHYVKRWVMVINEGAESHLFKIMVKERVRKGQSAGIESRDVESIDLHESIFQMGNNAEDIALVQAAGFHVDDDNAPLLENIPVRE